MPLVKITNPSFNLTYQKVISFNRPMMGGTTMPWLVRGIDLNTGSKGEFVLKPNGSERMSLKGATSELIVLFVARELGLNTLEPAIMCIEPDAVELLHDSNQRSIISKSLGFNFGTFYKPQIPDILKGDVYTGVTKTQAQEIFGFDVITGNADRSFIRKPNCLRNIEDLIVLDHETALGFLWDIFPDKEPWIVSNAKNPWIREHCFFNYLSPESEPILFDLCERLDNLDEEFWQKCRSLMPMGWQLDSIDKSREFIDQLRKNKKSFLEHILKLAS